MPATVRKEMGDTTLSKKWYCDVDFNSSEDNPDWGPVNAINRFKPEVTDTTKDDSDYAGEGWGSDVITKRKWRDTFTALRKVDPDTGTYDAGQEFLRNASDTGALVHMRWYEMPDDGPREEAYEGWCMISWSPDGGSDEDLDTVSVTLNGKGRRKAITHPDAAAVPRVYSVSPATALEAGGELIIVTGWGFIDMGEDQAVTVGGTDASDYEVVSNSKIALIVPAKAAGAHAVVVTNDTGPSTDIVTITYV